MNMTTSDIEKIAKYVLRGNFEAAKDFVNLIDSLERYKKYRDSNSYTWEYYVRVYDNNFYTCETWNDLVQSEAEMGEDGLSENELKELLGITVFQLPCGWYVHGV